MLAIIDNQAVIKQRHSIKGIERVVRCYENANGTSSGLDVKETKRSLESPESAMVCAHLSHFGYALHLLPERGFCYRACDEEKPKPQLVLTLLKIIS